MNAGCWRRLLLLIAAVDRCCCLLLLIAVVGRCCWLLLLVAAADCCCWSLLLVSAANCCSWSLLLVVAADCCWWSLLLVAAADCCSWSLLLVAVACRKIFEYFRDIGDLRLRQFCRQNGLWIFSGGRWKVFEYFQIIDGREVEESFGSGK